MSQADEVLPSSVEPEFPYVDIARTAPSGELLALPVSLYGSVKTVRENPFWLVICTRRLGKVGQLPGSQVNSHHRCRVERLVAGERHLVIVIVEVLRLQYAIAIFAFKYGLLVDEFRLGTGEIQVSNKQSRATWSKVRSLSRHLRKRNVQRLLGDGCALAHLLTKLHWFCSGSLTEKPEFVVAGAAAADVLEMIRSDKNVVPRDQMHNAEKNRARHIAGQAGNDARLQVNQHGIPKALRHKRHTLIIGRDIGSLPKVG